MGFSSRPVDFDPFAGGTSPVAAPAGVLPDDEEDTFQPEKFMPEGSTLPDPKKMLAEAPSLKDFYPDKPEETNKRLSSKPVDFDPFGPPGEQNESFAGDVGTLLKSGAWGMGETMRELVGMVPFVGKPVQGYLDSIDEWMHGETSETYLKKGREEILEELTPETKAARAKKWISDEGGFGDAWADPRSWLSGAIESVPASVATMLPGGVFARATYLAKIAAGIAPKVAAGAAARTAAIAGGITEGLMGGADTSVQIRQEIMALPKEVIANSEAIKTLVGQGMTQEQALEALASDASTKGFLISGVATGLFGWAGDKALVGIIANGLEGGLVKRIAKGAAKGAVQESLLEELPQGASQQFAANVGVADVDPRRKYTKGVGEAAVGGAVAGLVMGGGFGAGAGAYGRKADETPDVADDVEEEGVDASDGGQNTPGSLTAVTPPKPSGSPGGANVTATVDNIDGANAAALGATPQGTTTTAGKKWHKTYGMKKDEITEVLMKNADAIQAGADPESFVKAAAEAKKKGTEAAGKTAKVAPAGAAETAALQAPAKQPKQPKKQPAAPAQAAPAQVPPTQEEEAPGPAELPGVPAAEGQPAPPEPQLTGRQKLDAIKAAQQAPSTEFPRLSQDEVNRLGPEAAAKLNNLRAGAPEAQMEAPPQKLVEGAPQSLTPVEEKVAPKEEFFPDSAVEGAQTPTEKIKRVSRKRSKAAAEPVVEPITPTPSGAEYGPAPSTPVVPIRKAIAEKDLPLKWKGVQVNRMSADDYAAFLQDYMRTVGYRPARQRERALRAAVQQQGAPEPETARDVPGWVRAHPAAQLIRDALAKGDVETARRIAARAAKVAPEPMAQEEQPERYVLPEGKRPSAPLTEGRAATQQPVKVRGRYRMRPGPPEAAAIPSPYRQRLKRMVTRQGPSAAHLPRDTFSLEALREGYLGGHKAKVRRAERKGVTQPEPVERETEAQRRRRVAREIRTGKARQVAAHLADIIEGKEERKGPYAFREPSETQAQPEAAAKKQRRKKLKTKTETRDETELRVVSSEQMREVGDIQDASQQLVNTVAAALKKDSRVDLTVSGETYRIVDVQTTLDENNNIVSGKLIAEDTRESLHVGKGRNRRQVELAPPSFSPAVLVRGGLQNELLIHPEGTNKRLREERESGSRMEAIGREYKAYAEEEARKESQELVKKAPAQSPTSPYKTTMPAEEAVRYFDSALRAAVNKFEELREWTGRSDVIPDVFRNTQEIVTDVVRGMNMQLTRPAAAKTSGGKLVYTNVNKLPIRLRTNLLLTQALGQVTQDVQSEKGQMHAAEQRAIKAKELQEASDKAAADKAKAEKLAGKGGQREQARYSANIQHLPPEATEAKDIMTLFKRGDAEVDARGSDADPNWRGFSELYKEYRDAAHGLKSEVLDKAELFKMGYVEWLRSEEGQAALAQQPVPRSEARKPTVTPTEAAEKEAAEDEGVGEIGPYNKRRHRNTLAALHPIIRDLPHPPNLVRVINDTNKSPGSRAYLEDFVQRARKAIKATYDREVANKFVGAKEAAQENELRSRYDFKQSRPEEVLVIMARNLLVGAGKADIPAKHMHNFVTALEFVKNANKETTEEGAKEWYQEFKNLLTDDYIVAKRNPMQAKAPGKKGVMLIDEEAKSEEEIDAEADVIEQTELVEREAFKGTEEEKDDKLYQLTGPDKTLAIPASRHADKTKVKLLGSSTGAAMLDSLLAAPATRWTREGRAQRRHDADLRAMVGDTPVAIISDAEFDGLLGGRRANAFYGRLTDTARAKGVQPFIFLPQSRFAALSPAEKSATIRHELTHAATHYAIDNNHFGAAVMLEAMRKNMEATLKVSGRYERMSFSSRYGMENVHEMVTEAFTNPQFRTLLKQFDVSAQTRQQLGLLPGMKRTWYDTFLDILENLFRRLKGLPRETGRSYLDAIVSMGPALRMSTAQQVANIKTKAHVPSDVFGISALPSIVGDAYDAAKEKAVNQRWSTTQVGTKLNTSREMVRRMHELVPGPLADAFEQLVIAYTSVRARKKVYKEPGDKLTQRMIAMKGKDSKGMERTADLANDATVHRMAPWVALGTGANEHIDPADPKNAHAVAQHARLAKEFGKLTPEQQKLAKDLDRHHRTTENLRLKKIVRNILHDNLERYGKGLPAGQTMDTLVDWVVSGGIDRKLTVDYYDPNIKQRLKEIAHDKPLHDHLGKTARTLKQAKLMRTIPGYYVPLMRWGKYFISGTRTPAMPKGATHDASMENGYHLLFNDMADAVAYSKDLTHGEQLDAIKEEWLDAKGEHVKKPSAKEQKANPYTTRYRVRVQNKMMEMNDSKAALEEVAQQYRDQGYQVGDVAEVDKLRTGGSEILPGQINRVINNAQKAMEGKKGASQQAVIGALVNAYAQQLAGTRQIHRRIKRRNVKGWARDMIQAHDINNNVSSGNLVQLDRGSHMAELDDIIEKEMQSTRQQGKGKTIIVQNLVRELRSRIQAVEGRSEDFAGSGLVRGVLNLSFIDHLMSPAYSATNATQPMTMTYPVLAEDWGDGAALAEIHKALYDMGNMNLYTQGFKQTAKELFGSLRSQPIEAFDYGKAIRPELAKLKDGALLVRAYDQIELEGLASSGIEAPDIEEIGMGLGHKALTRTSRVARALPEAIEAVNRVNAMIAAVRLGKRGKMSDEKVILYAASIVERSQGGYSAENNPAFMSGNYSQIPMQFKKYPLLFGQLYWRTLWKMLRLGTDRKTRIQAAKSFVRLSATVAFWAGVGGLPLFEVAKALVMVAPLLGLGDGDWEPWEIAMQKWWQSAMKWVGMGEKSSRKAAEMISYGASRALDIDTSNRFAQNSAVLFGSPDSMSRNDVQSWAWDLILGAPGGVTADMLQVAGGQKRWEDGLPMPKFASDILKAYTRHTEGTRGPEGQKYASEISLRDAIVTGTGFRPASAARQWEAGGSATVTNEERKIMGQRSRLMTRWSNNPDQRRAIRAEIRDFNAAQRGKGKRYKIEYSDLLRSKRTVKQKDKERRKLEEELAF